MGNEHEWADQFSEDVDELLREAGRAEEEPTPEGYEELLTVARRLTQADWSGESQAREALRRQLLHQATCQAEEQAHGPRPWALAVPWGTWRRRLGTMTAVAASVVLMGVMLWLPGTLTATAQGLETLAQRVVLRRPVTTRIVAISEPAVASSVRLEVHSVSSDQVVLTRERLAPMMFFTDDGTMWTMQTSIGSFGERVPSGREASAKRFVSLAEAQMVLDYKLRQPSYLPEGYALRDAAVTPLDAVYLFYRGPSEDIILAQMRLEHDPWEEVAGATALTTMTDRPVRLIPLDGQVGSWIEGRGLIWQADDTGFLVGGTSLNLDEATRIATSLK